MRQRIDALTDKERRWVQSQLEGARRFVDAFAPEYAARDLSLNALDHAWAAWLETHQTDMALVNAAINVVGVAFGQLLVDAGPLDWVIATDEQGSDLAVYGLPGRGDVLVYPANFVAKRYERREIYFLRRSYGQITEHVRAVEASFGTPTKPKPWGKSR